MVSLYAKTNTFSDKATGEVVTFEQLYIDVDGVSVAIKPVFKADKRLLLVLADRKEK